MSKLNHKSILSAFILLAIFALGLFVLTPTAVHAADGRNVHFGPTDDNNSTAPRVTSGSATGGVNTSAANYGYSPFYVANINNPSTYSYTTTTKKSTASSNTSSNTSTSDNTDTNQTNTNDQAANAIFGSNSLAPSGLIQWVLFAIIVLLLVILVRKLLGRDRAYYATPLKHD